MKSVEMELGKFGGIVKEVDLQINIKSVTQLLACIEPDAKPYEKMEGLGICNVMNWS